MEKHRLAVPQAWVPPRWVELAYFASLFYEVVGQALGLSIPMAGTGMLAALAGRCVFRQRLEPFAARSTVALLLYCGACFVIVQLAVHGEGLVGVNTDFLAWMLSLIVLQALVRRPGFLHRFVVSMLVCGALSLHSLELTNGRVSVENDAGIGGNLAGANGFGQWFGFCAVYLITYGLCAVRQVRRAVSWGISLGCLGLMGWSGSRGTLLAVAAALVVAFRQQLKRAFIPMIVLLIVATGAYELGFFATAIDLYTTRGMEETGRGLVWPLAWARFVESPWVGVGLANLKTYIRPDKAITPHNSFLFLALSSGVVPAVLYLAHWWRAAASAFRAAQPRELASFSGPLLAFTILPSLVTNHAFLTPWATVAFLIAMQSEGRRSRNPRSQITQQRRNVATQAICSAASSREAATWHA